ncbi:MAG: FIST signal transduction protein, partial [Thermovirgaceae bacterium]
MNEYKLEAAALKTASESILFDGSGFWKSLEEACRRISARLGEPSFVLMAWSGTIDCLSLQRCSRKIFSCPFVGVHTPAFFTKKGLMTEGLGIWAVSGENVTARTLRLDNMTDDSWASGEQAACSFLEENPEKGVFIHFPEADSFDFPFFLHGFHGRTGPGFRHIGGMISSEAACGMCHFTEAGEGKAGGVIALLEGLTLEIESVHGFSPVGHPVILTRAKGSRIIELDYMPAAKRYKSIILEATGENIEDTTLYPLGVPGCEGNRLVRNLTGINEDGSIECVSHIPELSPLSVMRGTKSELLNGTEKICKNLKAGEKKPRFALAFDCVTRKSL